MKYEVDGKGYTYDAAIKLAADIHRRTGVFVGVNRRVATTQRELRRLFWKEHPNLSRKRITNYAGNGKMYTTDTRVAFVDWLDYLYRMGQVSQELAQRATLS